MSDTKTTTKKFSEFPPTSEGPIEVVGLKNGQNVKAVLTTDLVNTNPDVTFRDAKGRFRSTDDYSELTNQLKVNRFIANELDALNEAINSIDADGGSLTDEEKSKRLRAPFQYRGYLEMGDDGKPIAPWDEVKSETEDGVEVSKGGWWGHSTKGIEYGFWNMRDVDWMFLHTDNLAEAYEDDDYQGFNGAQKAPRNVGDTFVMEITNLTFDTWNDDKGYYGFRMPIYLEFRVEEIYYPEDPKGWGNSYAPMVRVSHVRDIEYYKWFVPPEPVYDFDWEGTGETSINVHLTGLRITQNDLYPTQSDLDEVENASIFRDETIKTNLEDTNRKQTAAIAVVESDVKRYNSESKARDDKLQEQIDAIDIPEIPDQITTEPDPGEKEGSLNWTDYTWSGDAIDALGKQARISKDRTKMSLNKDILEGGHRSWTALFEPYPSVIGMELYGTIHRVVVESTGQAGQNGRGHNFKILEHNLPMEEQTDAVVGIYPNYEDATLDLSIYITKEESKDDDRQLQAEIDQLALGLETLLQQREAGKWKYIGFAGDNIPRNAGEFALASDDLSAQDNVITLNQTDLDDKLHGFGDVDVGDYVEIVDLDKPDEYALFVVDSEPDGDGIVSINLKLKDKGNNFLVGTTCEIRFFAINEQDLNLTELDQRYLKLSGGTMTGTLTTPRGEVKTVESASEAVMLLEGNRTGTSNPAARLTMSNNHNANAYGSLSWKGVNGDGWFEFNKDVDMSGHGLHGATRVRLNGDKAICDGTTERIKVGGKVEIKRVGANTDGFKIEGRVDGDSTADLLGVYHNSGDNNDAINYFGKQEADDNLATVGYVKKQIPEGGKPALSLSFRGKSDTSRQYPFAANDFCPMTENGQSTNQMSQTRIIRWLPSEGHWAWDCEGFGRQMGTLTFTRTGGDHAGTFIVEDVVNESNYIKIRVRPDYAVNQFGSAWTYDCRLDSALREK